MVGDHQRYTCRFFLVLLQLQARFPRYIKYSQNLFIQVLLIVTLQKKVLFTFAGRIPKNLFLQTNTSESERLAIGNGSFAVYGVENIHAKVVVFVRGFNMQVCNPDPAVIQVDSCV